MILYKRDADAILYLQMVGEGKRGFSDLAHGYKNFLYSPTTFCVNSYFQLFSKDSFRA